MLTTKTSLLSVALRASSQHTPQTAELAEALGLISNAVDYPLLEVFAGIMLGVGLILCDTLTPFGVLARALFKNDSISLFGISAAVALFLAIGEYVFSFFGA